LYPTSQKTHPSKTKKTLWPWSARELYRPSDRRLSAKLVSTFVDRRCCVISTTYPYGRILGFLDRNTRISVTKIGKY
jgi:hypothetical protein